MKIFLKGHYLLSLLTLTLLSSSCVSTHLVSSSVAEDSEGFTPRKILILADTENAENRLLLEDSFVAALKEKGLEAVSGHALLPEGKEVNKALVLPIAQREGIDGVLLTRVKDVRKNLISLDAPMGFLPGSSPHYRARTGLNPVTHHSLVMDVDLSTELFDVAGSRRVWAGKTTSFDPKSSKGLIDELVVLVVKELEKAGFTN